MIREIGFLSSDRGDDVTIRTSGKEVQCVTFVMGWRGYVLHQGEGSKKFGKGRRDMVAYVNMNVEVPSDNKVRWQGD